MKNWKHVGDMVESITTKERHLLSLYLVIKKLMEEEKYEDVEDLLDEMIQTQRLNLRSWME